MRWKPLRVRYDKTAEYKNTNSIFGNILTKSNCPTLFGYLLHTFVYIIFVRLSMG